MNIKKGRRFRGGTVKRFMAIKSIENLKTNDLGNSNVLICPSCGKATELRLFENVDASMVAHLLKKPAQGIAVCPKCANVFSVNPHYVSEKKSGTVCELESQDLTVLTSGK